MDIVQANAVHLALVPVVGVPVTAIITLSVIAAVLLLSAFSPKLFTPFTLSIIAMAYKAVMISQIPSTNDLFSNFMTMLLYYIAFKTGFFSPMGRIAFFVAVIVSIFPAMASAFLTHSIEAAITWFVSAFTFCVTWLGTKPTYTILGIRLFKEPPPTANTGDAEAYIRSGWFGQPKVIAFHAMRCASERYNIANSQVGSLKTRVHELSSYIAPHDRGSRIWRDGNTELHSLRQQLVDAEGKAAFHKAETSMLLSLFKDSADLFQQDTDIEDFEHLGLTSKGHGAALAHERLRKQYGEGTYMIIMDCVRNPDAYLAAAGIHRRRLALQQGEEDEEPLGVVASSSTKKRAGSTLKGRN